MMTVTKSTAGHHVNVSWQSMIHRQIQLNLHVSLFRGMTDSSGIFSTADSKEMAHDRDFWRPLFNLFLRLHKMLDFKI
jgi:hypothetical protein